MIDFNYFYKVVNIFAEDHKSYQNCRPNFKSPKNKKKYINYIFKFYLKNFCFTKYLQAIYSKIKKNFKKIILNLFKKCSK